MLSLLSHSNRCRNWPKLRLEPCDAETERDASKQPMGPMAKVFLGSAWRCDLKASQLSMWLIKWVSHPSGNGQIYGCFNSMLKSQRAPQLLFCFLIAFAQDSLLFPAGLKSLPIHRTIVINIPIIRIPIVGWMTIPPKTSMYYDVIMFRPWHISVSHPFEIFPSASSGQLRAFRRLEGAQRMLPVWCRNERSPFPLLQVCKNRFCIIGLQSFPAQSGVETPPLPSLHCREFWRRSRNDRLVKGPGSGCTPKPIDHQNGQEWSFLVLWLYLFWGCMQKQRDQMIRTSIQKQSGSLN